MPKKPAAPLDPTALITAAALDVDQAAELLRNARTALTDAVRVAVAEHGWSWTEVGNVLGISKQAAHERFAGAIRQPDEGQSRAAAGRRA